MAAGSWVAPGARPGDVYKRQWLYNVIANPDVTLEFRGRTGHYRARVAEGAERDGLWSSAKRFIANYADYEQRAGDREIQIVVCEYVD